MGRLAGCGGSVCCGGGLGFGGGFLVRGGGGGVVGVVVDAGDLLELKLDLCERVAGRTHVGVASEFGEFFEVDFCGRGEGIWVSKCWSQGIGRAVKDATVKRLGCCG